MSSFKFLAFSASEFGLAFACAVIFHSVRKFKRLPRGFFSWLRLLSEVPQLGRKTVSSGPKFCHDCG